jgi:purine-nucleoside phosphorylase
LEFFADSGERMYVLLVGTGGSTDQTTRPGTLVMPVNAFDFSRVEIVGEDAESKIEAKNARIRKEGKPPTNAIVGLPFKGSVTFTKTLKIGGKSINFNAIRQSKKMLKWLENAWENENEDYPNIKLQKIWGMATLLEILSDEDLAAYLRTLGILGVDMEGAILVEQLLSLYYQLNIITLIRAMSDFCNGRSRNHESKTTAIGNLGKFSFWFCHKIPHELFRPVITWQQFAPVTTFPFSELRRLAVVEWFDNGNLVTRKNSFFSISTHCSDLFPEIKILTQIDVPIGSGKAKTLKCNSSGDGDGDSDDWKTDRLTPAGKTIY